MLLIGEPAAVRPRFILERTAMSCPAARWYSSVLLNCRGFLPPSWPRVLADARAAFGGAFLAAVFFPGWLGSRSLAPFAVPGWRVGRGGRMRGVSAAARQPDAARRRSRLAGLRESSGTRNGVCDASGIKS